MEFEIDVYKPEYHEQIIQVLRSELWSFRSEEECRKLFQWKYLDNPFTKTAAGCVAKYEGRVVSFFGLFIQEYQFDGERFLCAVRSDASTLPEFQGKGIFKKLTNFSLDYFHHQSKPAVRYILALSSNEASSAVYKKMGWQELGIKRMRYKLSVRGVLAYLMNRTKVLNMPQTIQQKEYIIQIGYDCISYASVKHLIHNPAHRISRNITEEGWKWRYAHPLQKNIFCTVMHRGEIKALTLFQPVIKNRYVLTDYFFNDVKAFKKSINTFSRIVRPSDIQAWVLGKNDDEIQALKTCGFRNLEFITRHIKRLNPPPALIRPCNPQIQDSDWFIGNNDVRDSSLWYFNPADSDIY